MEIQPLGWKSNQQINSEKLKVLDFAHATAMFYRKATQHNLVLYGWFGLVSTLSIIIISYIKTGFNHSLDGFPTIKMSQKREKANLWPNFSIFLDWEWSKLKVYSFQLT